MNPFLIERKDSYLRGPIPFDFGVNSHCGLKFPNGYLYDRNLYKSIRKISMEESLHSKKDFFWDRGKIQKTDKYMQNEHLS